MNRLSKLLLATTCLTAVNAAPAAAVSEVEPNNTLATAQILPLGTTQITGTLVECCVNFFDFYSLAGLQPSGSFVVTLDITAPASVNEAGMFALTSGGGLIDSDALVDGNQLTGTIPGNGILVLRVDGATNPLSEAVLGYTLDINAPRAAVPEPSVLSLLASGAAGLATLRGLWRKRQKS
jgi:hypothetical protein